MDTKDGDRHSFPIPADEAVRVAALHSCRVLDMPPQPSLRALTQLAGSVFSVPIALLSLLDTKRQIMLAAHGTDMKEMPRSTSFCAYALMEDDILFVPNATEDRRFADNPLVTGQPHIRFYAGAPLIGPRGHKLGMFCLIDHMPRTELANRERRMLKDFATIAAEIIASQTASRF